MHVVVVMHASFDIFSLILDSELIRATPFQIKPKSTFDNSMTHALQNFKPLLVTDLSLVDN